MLESTSYYPFSPDDEDYPLVPGTLKSLAKICEDMTKEYESQKKLTDFN